MSPVPQLDAESLNTKMEERRTEEAEEQLPLKSDSSNVDGDMVIVDHVSGMEFLNKMTGIAEDGGWGSVYK